MVFLSTTDSGARMDFFAIFVHFHLRVAAGKRARSSVSITSSYTPVYLQAWVRNPSRSQYWTVSWAGADAAEVRLVGRPEKLRHLRDVLAREEAFRQNKHRIQEEPRSATHQEASRKVAAYTELRPWLERTGWERVYANVNRQLLYCLTLRPLERSYRPLLLAKGLSQQDSDVVSPADDEAKIAALCHATYNIISRCEETAKTSSKNLLRWLRSVRPNNCYPKPFTLVARKNTRDRYISVLQRFVSMVSRAYRLSTTLRRDAAGVSYTEELLLACGRVRDHPDLDMNILQRRECESLTLGISTNLECEDREEISNRDEWEEDYSDSDDDRSSASSGDDGGSQLGDDEVFQLDDTEDYFCDDSSQNENSINTDTQHTSLPEAEAVEDAVVGSLLFELIMLFCTQEVHDGDPSQTLLVYFSGILGFTKDFHSFQPPRNYTSHLAALIYIQRLLFLEYAVPKRGYVKMGIPERNRRGGLARLQNVRHRFTVYGAESPFEEMFALLCSGRKIAAKSNPPIILHWSDDEEMVSVSDACSITMDDFKSVPRDLIVKADQICRELLYHLPPIEDLERIQDDFAKTDTGFSFIHHPANRLSKEYLRLCSRACAGTETRLASNGKWRHALVQRYMAKERLFLEHFAVLMHITGGGQPRSSDLLHLRCENTGAVERGIHMHKGSVVYLTRSHKAKRSTNLEFYVARFLPQTVGQLLFRYLVYIRPFVDMLSREVFTTVRGSCTIYLFRRGPESIAEPWPPSRLSRLIKKASARVWGNEGVSTRLLRQLSVEITDKHVRHMGRPFNLYDDRIPEANRNVVFAWQTGHRPLQRARTYELDGAYPARLQPAVIERYR
ncbi:hypothetical protein CI238_13008 [Colletotrichum incanum]|uniref:Uncharacterized protein n=1 Tax=Colletotrichum incanum TaxID=1573173 RepID=A0A166ZG36_COLIC|nr:hypothetical protein CI238_13008 [Colletotrichum incanum]